MLRPGPAQRASLSLRVLISVWVALILFLTLMPAFGTGTVDVAAPLADVVRNLVLFAPLGLLLGLAGRSPARVALLAALLSAGVELAQLWIPGRHPGVRDIAMDALGAAAGCAFARALLGPVFRSPKRSARLALAIGGLGAVVILLPGILLQPAPPESRYFTALGPDFPRYAVFPGAVLEAHIGELPIQTQGPSTQSGALREGLRDGSPITVRAVSEGRPAQLASLLRINDGDWEVLLVGVQGEDLVVRRHALAGDLGLQEPLFRASGAVPHEPGRPFRIELVPSGAGWLASIDGSRPRRVGPTPAAARRLVADSDAFSEPLRKALDALALGLGFGAIAIWLRARGPAIVGLALPIGAVILAPSVAGLIPSPPTEWAGVAIGLLGGGLVQAWVRRSSASYAPASRPGLKIPTRDPLDSAGA